MSKKKLELMYPRIEIDGIPCIKVKLLRRGKQMMFICNKCLKKHIHGVPPDQQAKNEFATHRLCSVCCFKGEEYSKRYYLYHSQKEENEITKNDILNLLRG